MSTTLSPELVSAFGLTVGTKFDFQGKRYEIIKCNPSNNRIRDIATGAFYNLNRNARVSNVEKPTYEQQLGILNELYTPQLGNGAVVRIKRGKFAGTVGIIAKSNATRYLIAIPNQASLLVEFNGVERTNAAELGK